MAHRSVHRLACFITLLAVTSSAKKEHTRWSRQISSYTSDIGDWVPLSGPIEKEPTQQSQIKRQAVAEPRILTEPFPELTRPTGFGHNSFPSRTYYNSPSNRQLYLQSVPSVPTAPQNYLNEHGFGQSIRFGLSQPNFPLTQGFVAPPFTFESAPPPPQPPKPRTQPVPPPPPNPISFPPSNIAGVSAQAKPFGNQAFKNQEPPKFIDGYRAENVTGDFAFSQKKKPHSLQKIKFDNVDKPPRTETIPQNTKIEREEVQLLYVPLESLNRGQFNFRSPLSSPQMLNSELYSQNAQKPIPPKSTFINDYQRPAIKPVEEFQGQNYFPNFSSLPKDVDQVPRFSTNSSPFPTAPPTTPKPKKLKPHQPPLAIFMTKETAKSNQVKVGDVLSSLKNADTIAVLDSVNPLNAPKVFIGPSNLPPPENFVKFELPYLSNIENSERKLKQLPFFVAPLSYNTPQGFAKIPFPSPHVGSVVINSLVRDTTQTQSPPRTNIPNTYISNSYTASPPTYKPEQKPTQKPSFSFYSTATPNMQPISNYQSNYYSFEPQVISSVRPPKQPESAIPLKPGSYFLSNVGSQYNSNEFVNFPQQENFKPSEAIDAVPPAYNVPRKAETTTTLRTTPTTTTTTTTTPKAPSTYPSQLLETHNPYSINQAFHFSTPLDYHNYFDDVKQPHVTPGEEKPSPPYTPSPIISSPPTKAAEIVTDKPTIQQHSTPVYLQNYNPEIHYNSKEQSWRYPVFNINDYTERTEISTEQTQAPNTINTDISSSVSNLETEHTTGQENSKEEPSYVSEVNNQTSYENYNQYETKYETTENPTTPISTTPPSIRRATPRIRGRPRYTTTSRPESYDYTTRTIVTRRPLKERKPLPTRPRYEPNRITTERLEKKPLDSNESTTKPTRTRIRGRIQYRPSDNDEIYDRRTKTHSSKEEDLAYQRDILHQNYPVTLMERSSTVDIEAITEPNFGLSTSKIQEPITETTDTENAYTNERASISQPVDDTKLKQPSEQTFPSRTDSLTTRDSDTTYVPKLSSVYDNDYIFTSKSSEAPIQSSPYNENPEEDIYVKHTPEHKLDKAESNSFISESATVPQHELSMYSVDEESPVKEEETTTTPESELSKTGGQDTESEEEENVVQTTPSYNRVRVRPGVIRQYHQASTESPRAKDRRRQHAVTYRPAFDKRRTTMRIEEIEADLKTKQVHSRPDFQDHKHPVYKPEPNTEPSSASPSATESSTKRGQFRRRRPSYSYTTSTESSSSTKRIYDIKNRFRGRRPTEKPTEKPEIQTEVPSSTIRSTPHTRYSHRPRLSERYNKKTDPESEVDDQESNFSFNRPKYVEPNTDQWSPKINNDSFKPYNPNDIVDESKAVTTERRSDKENVLDIITARNEYDDMLISVTPASNRLNKKMPDIPPTLEALVEQTRVTKSDSSDSISTFESMLEEVMKSLEEQDQDEYSTNVKKHKGGEIGEIPPERIISSGDNYLQKTTTIRQQETSSVEPATDASLTSEVDIDDDGKTNRRGFWKKVKVRPVTTESIEFAESQYYSDTVNKLGQSLKASKTGLDKYGKDTKLKVTTYKPKFDIIQNLFDNDFDVISKTNELPNVDILKIDGKTDDAEESLVNEESQQTTVYVQKEPQTDKAISPGDLDLGTGTPDPTLDDLYFTTEAMATKSTSVEKGDGYSFMDYLFGVTSEYTEKGNQNETKNKTKAEFDVKTTTEQLKPKIVTTETAFMPEEITTVTINEETTENSPQFSDDKQTHSDNNSERTEVSVSVSKVESSSVSSFMNPANVVSTSMSTEISHETEICFRGKCIKTSKDIL